MSVDSRIASAAKNIPFSIVVLQGLSLQRLRGVVLACCKIAVTFLRRQCLSSMCGMTTVSFSSAGQEKYSKSSLATQAAWWSWEFMNGSSWQVEDQLRERQEVANLSLPRGMRQQKVNAPRARSIATTCVTSVMIVMVRILLKSLEACMKNWYEATFVCHMQKPVGHVSKCSATSQKNEVTSLTCST